MKSWVVVALVVGCGAPAKPEPLESPTPLDRPHEVTSLEARAPKLDLQDYTPDISEYGRWPLTVAEHPELEPHFAIAEALAQPGITWQELCARGAQQRLMASNADYGEYLAAWCSVAKDDTHDALFRLGNLHRSLRLRAAIELDATAIVVANLDGGAVEGELRRANLLELRIVDRVSAAYFEVGKLDSAEDLNRLAKQMDRTPNAETSCARHLRAIADGGHDATLEVEILAHLPAPKVPSRCETLAEELVCWTGKRCATENYGALKREAVTNLVRARSLWPTGYAGFQSWYAVAELASRAWPVDKAWELAVPALELALRTSRCRAPDLHTLQILARFLSFMPDLDSNAPSMSAAERTPLTAEMARQYAPRLSAVIDEIRELPNLPGDECNAKLGALPPVIVP
jgi:hypothetical protein